MMRCLVAFCVIVSLAPATRADPPASAPTSAPAEKKPDLDQTSDLLRVDLRDRRLAVALVPPRDVKAVVLKVGAAKDEWTVETVQEDQQRDGTFTRFAISCDERQTDRWSPLHLGSVNADGQTVTISGVGRVNQTFVSVTYVQDVTGVRLMVQRARRMRARPLDDDR